MRLIRRISQVLIIMLLLSSVVFAADNSLGAENSAHFGIFTVLPPLIAISLAFITRNVMLSLFFGVFAGTFMLSLKGGSILYALGAGFVRTCIEAIAVLSDSWNAGIVLQVLMIGALIALVTRLGGIQAVADAISKIAKGPRSTQMATWIMGLIIFFDDYANSLTVGPTMRPATDKQKISRERLSFIVDATAAPISGMALISTWVAFELGVIKNALNIIGSDAHAYGMFVASLPFRYYNIFILLLIVVTALMLREFGPMYKAEVRARTTGAVLRPGSVPMMTDTMVPMPSTDDEPKSSVWFAIIPIGVLIVGAFAGFYISGYLNIIAEGNTEVFANGLFTFDALIEAFGNSDASVVLFLAAFAACVSAILMGLFSKMLNIKESLDTVLEGIKSMNITAVILVLAWSLSGVINELGTSIYIVEHLASAIPAWSVPAFIFILGSIISFATGTSYGTMAILMPLAVPLAWSIEPTNAMLVLAIGAVLTGAIFGDHCSPISDTSILSAMGSAVDLMDHINTQMPYALVIAGLSIIIYILAGLGMNVWLTLLLGTILVIAIVRVFGKKVPDAVETPHN